MLFLTGVHFAETKD